MKTTTGSLLLTAVICLVLAQVGEAEVSDFDGNLIAYWKLDQIDGSGDTPEEVSSYTTSVNTSGVDAVTVTSTGKVGVAFNFTGNGADRVKTDGTVNVGTSFSVSAWVRVLGTSGFSYRRIVENSYLTSFFLGDSNAGKYSFIVNANDNGLSSPIGPDLAIDSNNWVHVAGTYDSASETAILYVNNNPATNTGVTAPGPTNLNVSIGSSGSAGDCWDGDIDEVRIYNRALTAGEISDLYNNIGLVAPPRGSVLTFR